MFHNLWSLLDRLGLEEATNRVKEALVFKEDGNAICSRDVVYSNDLVPF
jgi:hypothetical protein